MKEEDWNDYLWIWSELFYYGGLVLSVVAIPALGVSLWVLNLADVVHLSYTLLWMGWVISLLMFLMGIWLKNRLR